MDAVRLVLRQLGGALQLRRLMETRLAEERTMAEQERMRMLGMVSASLVHEVKNPLSSIKVLAETVGEELSAVDPDSEQAEDLGLIVDQIDRLNWWRPRSSALPERPNNRCRTTRSISVNS